MGDRVFLYLTGELDGKLEEREMVGEKVEKSCLESV